MPWVSDVVTPRSGTQPDYALGFYLPGFKAEEVRPERPPDHSEWVLSVFNIKWYVQRIEESYSRNSEIETSVKPQEG